jgi:hypothetical protein
MTGGWMVGSISFSVKSSISLLPLSSTSMSGYLKGYCVSEYCINYCMLLGYIYVTGIYVE